ncbi:hypothetical protein B5M42_007280 [Paenibacillus athensensis]|uniref:Glycoside hydrolase family 44 catalytic domain-containing protein n=1 Tax=Paenibacillus athensensis TaxID=1967502 RepID=A0A4Y8Q282_9BACL|nr:glycoside hydrolase family 44 protein [Paenibacillus athensensis]MCD1258634.1 hypothetical protein [Paenibacillus athensensis]
MKRKSWITGAAAALLVSGLLPWAQQGPTAAAAERLAVYDDALQNNFSDYSWAAHNMAQTAVVHSGANAVEWTPDGDAALYFYKDRIVSTNDYPVLELWVNGGTAGGQQVQLGFHSGGQRVATVDLAQQLPGGTVPANSWTKVDVDLGALNIPYHIFDGIMIQGTTSGAQSTLYLDDIALVPGEQPEPTAQPSGTPTPTAEPTGEPEPTPTPTEAPGQEGPELIVFDDALHSPFRDYSWAQHDVTESGTVHDGTASIRMNPSNEAGLYLYKENGPVLVKEYETLEFWVNGGAAGGQDLKLKFNAGGGTIGEVPVDSLIEGGIPAGEWAKVSVFLPDLKLPGGLFDAILLQGGSGEQAELYLDDMRILPKYVAPPVMTEVVLSQYQLVLTGGDTAALQLTANYNNGSSADASAEAVWTSNAPNVVSVGAGGALEAQGNGIAKITATVNGLSTSAYVQVTDIFASRLYTDSLEPGYTDWSWGTRELESDEQAYSGSHSVKFAAKGYEGVWFHKDGEPFSTLQTYGVRLHVLGGGAGGQKLKLVLQDGRGSAGDIELDPYLPAGGLPAGQWVEATVKLADLGISTPSFDGIVIQAWGEQNQGSVYFDDIEILQNSDVIALPDPELPQVDVAIDQAAGRRTVNPDIFGVNFEDQPSENASELIFPFKRWGGNQMTRYNWELDTTNRGSDWYFLNIPYDTGVPGKSLSDQFIESAQATQTKVLMQVPTIGWTPKSRDISWSFSIDKYGPQAGNECDYHEAWCRADAGNGQLPNNGGHVTGNDPTDTSKQVGPEFIGRWVDDMKNKFNGYVHNYALDNEPALWGYAHWDVHPQMTSYDEIWNYTVDYGTAIKAKDPQANIFGPVSWGWCEYFYSAKDGCSGGDDMSSHDGKPFLEWYLSKVHEYEQQHQQRLVDVLDIHYYPAENNVPFSSDESPGMTKRRFNSLKSLYDPNFQDPSSWIQEPVYLIPRMRDIIARNAPETKLAITEYNFGDGAGIGSGLTQAEALAIFAREGVDAATRWGALIADTPLEDAFKLYLNYDGQGSKITGDIVQTTSSNRDAVGAYTVVSPDGKTYVLLFNKDTSPRTAKVTAASGLTGQASLFRFTAKQRLQAAGQQQVEDGEMSVRLPGRSATLVVIE